MECGASCTGFLFQSWKGRVFLWNRFATTPEIGVVSVGYKAPSDLAEETVGGFGIAQLGE
jgi:hypothetical protein